MTDPRLHILLVEDSPTYGRLVGGFLRHGFDDGFDLEQVHWLSDALARLERGGIDMVLLDLTLPDSAGLDTFRRLHASAGDVPTVVLTGTGDESLAVQAVRQGAQDYLLKDHLGGDNLARSVRFAVERTRRLIAERDLHATRQQIELARIVQQHMYPDCGPRLDGVEFAGTAYPAEATCGDYFDYLPMPGGMVGVAVGDVSGHGQGAALVMVETRASVRALSKAHPDPGAILTEANELLTRNERSAHFVSVFLACLDPAARRLVYASAGHPAYRLDRAGTAHVLEGTGPVLGMLRGAAVPSAAAVTLEPGDVLLIPTDGITEAARADGQRFGTDRMLDVVRRERRSPAAEIVRRLYEAVRRFADRRPLEDDLTAVVIKILGGP
jgi:serine phosphatase RsbU (regulator of sigma subunit)